MLESKKIQWDLNAVVMETISLVPLNLHTHRPRGWSALYSGCIGHDKTQTGHHMRKFYEVLSSSRYLARQNRWVKFLELMQISPMRQDVICVDRDAYLEVRNVLCERSKCLPESSQDSPKNFTLKKVLQA